MRTMILTALLAGGVVACSTAETSATANGNDDAAMASAEEQAGIYAVLAADIRAEDATRDKYRHPAETLEFMQVEPTMKVGEYAPGGGWYTKILAPWLKDGGEYVGLGISPDNTSFPDDRKASMAAFSESFPKEAEKDTGIPAAEIPAYTVLGAPADAKGTFDRILIFRMMHNMMRWGIAGSEIDAMRDLLKPGGMIGIVQHRAKADAPADYVDGSKGYLKQADVVKFMEAHGFELAGESEVNANPNDTADYPGGVWTLPPSYALKDKDREKYEAIGESDRMTLLFKKKG